MRIDDLELESRIEQFWNWPYITNNFVLENNLCLVENLALSKRFLVGALSMKPFPKEEKDQLIVMVQSAPTCTIHEPLPAKV